MEAEDPRDGCAGTAAETAELRQEGDYLTLYHFGRKFGVHKETGTVKAMEDDGPVSLGSRMNIYNLFWYSKADARFQDRWVPFRDVKDAGPFAPAFEKHVLLPFARTFTGKTEQLLEAAKKLGAGMVKQETPDSYSGALTVSRSSICSGMPMKSSRHREIFCLITA